MPRLYRPAIPLSVKCEVARRQIAHGSPTFNFLNVPEKPLWLRLSLLLTHLAKQIGCRVDELRLDHDPALGARAKSVWSTTGKTHYIPEANSPQHLAYRPHGPEHAGSHLIKTNVRGDHGQHPDRVLIKKQRRIENPKPKRKFKWASRKFERKKA